GGGPGGGDGGPAPHPFRVPGRAAFPPRADPPAPGPRGGGAAAGPPPRRDAGPHGTGRDRPGRLPRAADGRGRATLRPRRGPGHRALVGRPHRHALSPARRSPRGGPRPAPSTPPPPSHPAPPPRPPRLP